MLSKFLFYVMHVLWRVAKFRSKWDAVCILQYFLATLSELK